MFSISHLPFLFEAVDQAWDALLPFVSLLSWCVALPLLVFSMSALVLSDGERKYFPSGP